MTHGFVIGRDVLDVHSRGSNWCPLASGSEDLWRTEVLKGTEE